MNDPDFDVPSQPAIAARKKASLILYASLGASAFPIHFTTLAGALVDHTCQSLFGEGSFTLVRSEWRVGPDLQTTYRGYKVPAAKSLP